ncbi:MAG TPA: elongation factor P [Thermomicrobiales bacterium]|jgi:elongation factor P|nr:elongation factor P [Chloroflexota bacterium]HQX61946.1 elongation factor P [Thermomicrobiales bacterium]HBY46099.1 elongation factor P [Chloroflexota bacterium]HCG28505.1 elongation factor P [Chloroflexota bacterium]HQZ88682.1 elongation factor P [Thermomicrobiales bacterium]
MIDTGDLRKGLIIEHDGTLQRIIDYQHVKQGRGSAFVRLTMRNLRTGSTTQQTFQAGSRFPLVRLERQRVQYLYLEDDTYIFMDLDSFEQLSLTKETLGDAVNYLKEQDTIDLMTYQEEAIDIEMPITVELVVTQTDPGFRGDTATGGNKPATLETGVVVNVPLFINEGDTLKIDTRTGEYLERVT